ncbi:MAG: 6-phosphogluconolactonase [Candidatus Hydrothermarchaeales archaeon]
MAESVKPEIKEFQNLDSLSIAAAEEIVETAREAVSEKGRFSLVLAGGNTPSTLYRLLATEYADRMPWSSTHLFWGDERYVSKDHPESNYKMAYQTLISKLSIPIQNVHPIPTEMGNAERDATSYEEELRGFFSASKRGEHNAFDLILLGVGEDGHTASLFPENPVLEEKQKWVASILAPPIYKTQQRITITLPIINKAKKVFFLVSGNNKRKVVKAVLEDQDTSGKLYPAGLIRPKGELVWFLSSSVL